MATDRARPSPGMQAQGRRADGTPRENRLLRELPEADYARLAAALAEVELGAGDDPLAGAPDGGRLFFIGSGLLSIVRAARGNAPIGVALVGREGVVGVGVVPGMGADGAGAIVHTPVRAWCLEADPAWAEFARGGAFQRRLLVFARALFEQMARTAVCARQHRIDDRLCRWVLLALDRLGGLELPMTHAAMARTLGIRRASVTEAAARLERHGLIEQHRGCLRVRDRAALEARACACYHAIRREYRALLDDPEPSRAGS